ncbi:hypothetical protein GCM10009853_101130 [Glycomyces scopariae]|uniref:hypothetical protein n=1 Tax=Chryseobacterium ginsenosidimutans TaxID=687846 RepID=UPI0031CF5E23
MKANKMNEIRIFGTRFIHKPNFNKESMKINGFEYSENEVLEALKEKGYNIVRWNYSWQDESFPNGKTNEVSIVKCALKDREQPSEQNIWYKVAEKEFRIKNKPSLI